MQNMVIPFFLYVKMIGWQAGPAWIAERQDGWAYSFIQYSRAQRDWESRDNGGFKEKLSLGKL